MAPYQVHNVRFFDLQPRSAHCLAYCEERKLLALSRADTSIEIWNFTCPNSPILERSISGHASEGSIEALAWAKPANNLKKGLSRGAKEWRLFSAGLHGLVIEHKLDLGEDENESENDYLDSTTSRKSSWSVTSGAVWCMKFNEAVGKLAVGTEEGFVCLFEVTSEGLDFDKVLDKQEGRILCLDWHTDGKHIVTGSPDNLRLWDVVSGHPLLRMSTGRTERNRETIVWSVGIMDDLTIVSGDSRGKTSFWNGKTGTLVDSYQTHKADVLAVAVTKDQQVVYSSGVDPVLMQFQPVIKNNSSDQRRKWVKSIHRTSNTHDVRALACIGKRVVSVGVDSNLCVSGPGRTVVRYPPIPHGENIVVASDTNYIAMRKQTSVEVWKMGKAHPANVDYGELPTSFGGKILALQEQPIKVLELKTRDDEIIENFHISPTADFVAYLTGTKLRVYKLDIPPTGDILPKIRRVELVLKPKKVPNLLRFYRHNSTDFLLTATPGLGLKCYQMSPEDNSATPIFRLSPRQMNLKSEIAKLSTNSAGTFAVLSDFDDSLIAVDLSTERVSCKFPEYDAAPISCFSIHPKTDNVVIVYADSHFVECNSKSGKFTKFSANFLSSESLSTHLPKEFTSKVFPTTGIIFPRSQKKPYDDSIIFYDVEKIFVFDKSILIEAVDDSTKMKSAKLTKTSEVNNSSNGISTKSVAKVYAMTVTKKYDHLVHLDAFGPIDESGTPGLVAVEVRPESLESQLPPSLRQKKFGAM